MRFSPLLVALAALAVAAMPGTPAMSSEVKGRPRVLSGDTVKIDREIIRLYGIDAPEENQYCENEYGRPFECGIQALDALSELIGQRSVTCVGDKRNEERQLLAVCYAGDMNLNSRMVRTGWAVARTNEDPELAPMERLAKSERAGIWALKFLDPAEWRKQNK